MDASFFQAVLEQAPVSIIVAGRDGNIIAWNRASEALFGFSAGEVLGHSLDLIIPEHLRKSHWDGFERSLASGTTKYAGQVMTTRATTRDGRKLYVEFSFGMLKDAEGNVTAVMAVGRDGTARFLADREARMKASPAS
ncbi:MAG TPA: PAS domain S-box protein [Usitatibacter sp.]|jgi:PAS domain S-box-containing protein|nr:PAS domain S-box protein [Usitatibacter sp.]